MWKLHPPLPVYLTIQERVGKVKKGGERQEPISEANVRQVGTFLPTWHKQAEIRFL